MQTSRGETKLRMKLGYVRSHAIAIKHLNDKQPHASGCESCMDGDYVSPCNCGKAEMHVAIERLMRELNEGV